MTDIEGDPRFEKARTTLSRFSPGGREERIRAMKARARLTMVIGLALIVLGALSSILLVDVVPNSISWSVAFIGMVITGFGIVVHLVAR